MSNIINVSIWRRGRSVIRWQFTYYDAAEVARLGSKRGYTTAGWYHRARKYTYRLTVDHDYPNKPIWLGRLLKGRQDWISMEGLYEPLVVHHPAYTFSTRRVTRNRRSQFRTFTSKKVVRAGIEGVE